MPDIHAIADHIAAIGSVNTCKVRRTLLDQWMASHAGVQQLESADVTMVGEDSMLSAGTQVDSQDSDMDDLELLRAVYLLQHPTASSEETLLTLINCARDSTADGVAVSQQIRAVRCLFLLTDISTVHHLSTAPNWPDYLTTLIYTSELQRLRVLTDRSRASFETVDKSGLVRALCRCHDNTSGRLAACLAVDFRLSDSQLWKAIIRRLSSSNVEVLVQPLPCHSRSVTDDINNVVLTCLNKDAVNVHSAVTICLLMSQCATYIDHNVVHRCALEFSRHHLPICCMACLLMLPTDPSVMQLIDSTVSSMSDGLDAEMQEFISSGHVLPTALQIMTLLTSNKH